MTNEEINNGLDEMQRKIKQQSERIELLNNAIDEFKKQCDNIVKLTKTTQTISTNLFLMMTYRQKRIRDSNDAD